MLDKAMISLESWLTQQCVKTSRNFRRSTSALQKEATCGCFLYTVLYYFLSLSLSVCRAIIKKPYNTRIL